jgi:hypothetical protein
MRPQGAERASSLKLDDYNQRVDSLTPLRRGTLIGLMVLWIGGGGFLAWTFCSGYPRDLAAALFTTSVTGLVIAGLHFSVLRLFPSRTACIGFIIAKLCALPLTAGFGMLALGLVAMSTDSGMQAGAQMAYFTIPVGMVITAIPTSTAACIGAAVGQMMARRRGRRATVAAK